MRKEVCCQCRNLGHISVNVASSSSQRVDFCTEVLKIMCSQFCAVIEKVSIKAVLWDRLAVRNGMFP